MAGSVVDTAVVVVEIVVVVANVVVVGAVDWAILPQPAATTATEAKAMSLRMEHPFQCQDREEPARLGGSPPDVA
jgi:hypothetical protein